MFKLLKKKFSNLIEKIKGKIEGEKPKFIEKVFKKKIGEKEIENVFKDISFELIEADVSLEVVEKIKENLKEELLNKEIKIGDERKVIKEALKNSLRKIFEVGEINLEEMVKYKKPISIIFLGFNGSGKTTSLVKVANFLIKKGFSCVVAAADTFRAAAIEQLEEYSKNLKIKIIKHKYGSDPAAVAYDAISYAKNNNIDFVLIDTAGRAHTNKNLMEQMKKIIRVNKPDLKILVIDSLTGNDAVIQARMFNELNIDALIFTKVDVNEKGGCILSVTFTLKKPILFLMNGQNYENIKKFEVNEFLENLIGD